MCACVRACVRMYVCGLMCMFMFVYMYAQVHIHLYTYMYVRAHVCRLCIHVYACCPCSTHVHMYVRMYISSPIQLPNRSVADKVPDPWAPLDPHEVKKQDEKPFRKGTAQYVCVHSLTIY